MRRAVVLCLLFSVGYVGLMFGITYWMTHEGAIAVLAPMRQTEAALDRMDNNAGANMPMGMVLEREANKKIAPDIVFAIAKGGRLPTGSQKIADSGVNTPGDFLI